MASTTSGRGALHPAGVSECAGTDGRGLGQPGEALGKNRGRRRLRPRLPDLHHDPRQRLVVAVVRLLHALSRAGCGLFGLPGQPCARQVYAPSSELWSRRSYPHSRRPLSSPPRALRRASPAPSLSAARPPLAAWEARKRLRAATTPSPLKPILRLASPTEASPAPPPGGPSGRPPSATLANATAARCALRPRLPQPQPLRQELSFSRDPSPAAGAGKRRGSGGTAAPCRGFGHHRAAGGGGGQPLDGHPMYRPRSSSPPLARPTPMAPMFVQNLCRIRTNTAATGADL